MVAGIAAIILATTLCVGVEEPARRFGRRIASKAMAVNAAV
jgi:hypothetical protein